jgi:hypothetical protein
LFEKGFPNMKKKIFAAILTLVLMIAVGGCSAEETPASVLERFHIAIAEEELLDQYDSFHEYTADESSLRVIIWTDTEVKDFAFFSIDYDETGDQISLLAGDVLFSLDELSPEMPAVIEMTAPEVLPLYGISFLDEDDVRRYLSINYDGRGEDEAPPYFFHEF